MTTQGGQDGVAAFMEYAFLAAPGGQNRFVGVDSKGFVLNYSPGFLWAIVDGFWVHPDDFNASDGSSVTFSTAVDPGTHVRLIALSPFNIANVYSQLQSDTLYTKRRNRITDPGMRISQENGNNAVAVGASGQAYPSDSFSALKSMANGGLSVQRIALTTPGGSPYRIRATVTTANAAPATGDYALWSTRIEGVDIADLKFGIAAPRQIAIRFGVRSAVAGTFPIALQNGSLTNRSWIGTYTIAPAEVGTDVVKSVTLTGDTTGTWATDNNAAFQISFGLNAGATYQGVLGWQSGNVFSTSGSVNFMQTVGNTIDLFDVGLYDVTGLTNGVIPPFELGSYTEDLAKCLRYYWTMNYTGGIGIRMFARYVIAEAYKFAVIKFPQAMRTTPSFTYTIIDEATNGAPLSTGVEGSSADYASVVAQGAANDRLLDIRGFVANARL
jgi:hypothetical protein